MRRSRWLLFFPFLSIAACGHILDDDPPLDEGTGGDASVADGDERSETDGSGDASDDAREAPDFPFDMTFENGLTGPNGATEPSRASLDTTAPLFGTASARIVGGEAASIVRSFVARDSVYVSFYLRVEEPLAEAVIFELHGASGTIAKLHATLSDAGSDVVTLELLHSGASDVVTTVPIGTTYRVGVRCHYAPDAGSAVSIYGRDVNGFSPLLTAQVTPKSGPPTRIVLGSSGDAGAAITLTVDDIYGRADDFAPPSQ